MGEDEQNALADKLAAALVADEPYRSKEAAVQAAVRGGRVLCGAGEGLGCDGARDGCRQLLGRAERPQPTLPVQLDADPAYDLGASLSARPQLRGTPRPPPPTAEQLGANLEAQKGLLMEQHGMVRGLAQRERAGWAVQAPLRSIAAWWPVWLVGGRPPPHPFAPVSIPPLLISRLRRSGRPPRRPPCGSSGQRWSPPRRRRCPTTWLARRG